MQTSTGTRLLGALTLAAAGCGVAAAPEAPNVILICMDTVRADRLGCYGYDTQDTTPRLDRLAREGTFFADASANACWTKPSVPSFLTGTYPAQHGVYEGSSKDREGEVSDVLPEAATTLAEVFERNGWDTAAFVRNAQLRDGMGFEQGFGLYQDEAGDAREIRWRAQDWLDARDGERPFFLYLHLLDAHWPYPIPEEYATRFASEEAVAPFRGKGSRALWDAVNDGERDLTEQERRALAALYDGSLRYIDDQLAELFTWLERHGSWEDTIVCVISDHGEEFGEHGRLGHGHGLYENLLRVPWILRVPGRAPERVEAPVSLIDLFPTLLSAAGIDAGDTSEGVDRLAPGARASPIFAEHKEPRAYLQSLRAGSDKLVRRWSPVERPEGESSGPRPGVGRRYDVDLVALPGGGLRALRVSAGEDDSEDEPELKGSIEDLRGTRFSLGGVPVDLTSGVVFYGELPEEGGSIDALREGLLVKVVAAPRDGTLEALRVKLYAPDAEPELELRGTLEEFEGDASSGRLSIAGLRIEVDARTRWRGVGDEGERELPREVVHAWLRRDDSDDVIGYTLEGRLFDLASDGAELAPSSTGAALEGLDGALDGLGARLAEHPLWSADDRRRLDDAALEDLRALGYVR